MFKKNNKSTNKKQETTTQKTAKTAKGQSDSKKNNNDIKEVCQEYLDGWRRAQADYLNLQRQVEEEKKEYINYANENLLMDLLPAIEQFEMALAYLPDLTNIPDQEKNKIEKWFIGIKAVKQMWEQTFSNIGLTTIDTSGKFNPAEHNAIDKEVDPDKEKDTIIKVVQVGWKLKNKVLRPAKVIVNDPDKIDSNKDNKNNSNS